MEENVKYEKLYALAKTLVENEMRMPMLALALTMESSDFRTTKGEKYTGSASAIQRIPTLLYDYAHEKDSELGAAIVQAAFCNEQGQHMGRGPAGARDHWSREDCLAEVNRLR